MEYGAIDLHLKRSLIRIVDEDGAVVCERTVPTSRDGFRQVFAGRSPMRVLLETGTESEWVRRRWRRAGTRGGRGSELRADVWAPVAPVKTDRRDVAALAEACRLGIYRRAHRVSAAQRQTAGSCGCASSWCGCGRKRSICCARSCGRRGIGCRRAVRRRCPPAMRAWGSQRPWARPLAPLLDLLTPSGAGADDGRPAHRPLRGRRSGDAIADDDARHRPGDGAELSRDRR